MFTLSKPFHHRNRLLKNIDSVFVSIQIQKMHYNCRNNIYPGTDIKRFPVPDEKNSWEVQYNEYDPPNYTSPGVFNKPYSDPEIGTEGFKPDWNSDNGLVNRLCGSHNYAIDKNGYPINPVGRTGLQGRGLLGRWGSNCAGDAIVTRWKIDPDRKEKVINKTTGKPYLQFVAIKRKDCGEWAIPGGFADHNEGVINTVKREFFEEALNSLSDEFKINKDTVVEKMNEVFKNGKTVYSGYVDDRRNTDQAWITTLAVNFHDESGHIFNDITLKAGDDAGDVAWIDIDSSLKLYASHKNFIEATARKLDAHF